ARYPHAPAIVDELGVLSFREVQARTNSLSNALADSGVRAGDGVAFMCRNHRGFVEASVACSKLGAHSLFLNTSFAGPQVSDVVRREDPVAVIYDQEFAPVVDEA